MISNFHTTLWENSESWFQFGIVGPLSETSTTHVHTRTHTFVHTLLHLSSLLQEKDEKKESGFTAESQPCSPAKRRFWKPLAAAARRGAQQKAKYSKR